MEKILLLSFLGKGRYNESLYYRLEAENKKAKSYLSPLANAYLEKERGNDVEIKFFITKEVKENFLENPNSEHGQNINNEINNLHQKGISVTFENIPEGRNYNELEEIISIIKKSISEFSEKEIIFDLTHGLRHISTFTTGVIFYLKNLQQDFEEKNIILYYGAYDIRKEFKNKPPEVPILNISSTLELSNLTLALEEFKEYGITKRIEKALRNIQKLVATNKLCNVNKLKFSSLSTELSNFNNIIKIPASPEKIINSILKIKEILDNSIIEFRNCSKSTEKLFFIEPINYFLATLRKIIVEDLFYNIDSIKNDNTLTREKIIFMANFIKLLLKWEMYSEAMIQIRELLIDLHLLAKGQILYYDDKEKRERIFWEDSLKRNEIAERLDKLTKNIIDTRNKIAHAGRGTDDFKKENLKKLLLSYVREIEELSNNIELFEKKEATLKRKVYLLNSIIIPLSKDSETGNFDIEKITKEKFYNFLKNALNEQTLDSAIGHDSIKHFIKEQFDLDIPLERKEIYFAPGEEAIVIKLEKRPEEGKIYTKEEMDYMEENNLIGYYYIKRKF
ncbi:protein of unknown function (DUF1874)/CRISPR-associated protein (cas_TM1812) [Marinitoga piezophila KA3]|uniref:CRISPR-associated protein, TM1812 family n=1 Tax=Marinitoga piezophila (strain DSM 14283 / JCM 11233 / KA3) TaxID=443254 RepID=H2J4R5_MARPK|nr:MULTISPECIES: TM1812 family CRISPR-associated protein [Marinitoga]AEX84850.1 protein of unknown function (DUF1874)/CRISPR-associated protein (cas_TM1812) [Marinitoga piezophila KA3]